MDLAKRRDEAVAAVPDEFCDEMSLVGPVARIRERYRAWADCGSPVSRSSPTSPKRWS